jgi:xylulose-5-phosphate/fructose-6-phosphate phosphoketolase
MDVIDRLPQTGSKGQHLKQQLQNKLIEHKRYIDQFGRDRPQIRNWRWDAGDPFDADSPGATSMIE